MTSGNRKRNVRGANKRNSLRWQILSTLSRRSLHPTFESLEERKLMAVNIGAVRPDLSFANDLLVQHLDTQPLAGPRDSNPEISFHFGFSASSDNGSGPQGFDDYALSGDLSGVGFDQVIVARPFEGALQWLGDTDRDTSQEYLFRFGLADMTPLIADMNGDGIDDVIAVDTTTTSNLLEWYVHFGVEGASPFPTNDSTLSVDATFSFGVDADHVAAGGGLADIPQVGDINGDGRADAIAVRNGAITKDWYISYAAAAGNPYPNNTATVLSLNQTITGYGANAAIPVVGDWDNDGDDNIGAINEGSPSLWNLDTNGGGAAELTPQFGLTGDQYIVGQWADVLWQGDVNNNWATAGNWSSDAVPTLSQSVVLDQPGSTSVLVTSAANARSIVSREPLSLQSGTLSVAENSTFQSGLTVSGGTLSTAGIAALQGTSTWSAGGFAGAGSVINTGTLGITGSVVMGATPFTNSGTVNQTGASVTLNSSTINNQSGATYNLVGNVTLTNNTGTSAFNNAGTFIKSSGSGVSSLGGNLNFNLQGGLVQVDTGVLSLRGGTSTGGTFVANASTTLHLTGNATQNWTGIFASSGTGGIFVNGTSSIVVGAGGATLNFAASNQLTFANGGGITANGTLTNQGLMRFDGASSAVATAGTINNQGTIRHVAGTLNLNSSTINNQVGGTFEFGGATALNNNSGTSNFNNLGTVLKSAAGVSTLNGNLSFNNQSGSIQVDAGVLSLRGGTSTGGTYSAASGTTLHLTGNGTQTWTGTHTGSGTGGIFLNGPSSINVGAAGTTLNFPTDQLNVTGGASIGGSGTLTNQGAIKFNAPATTFAMSGVWNNSGTLQFQSGTANLNSATINNLSNGTMEFVGASAINGASGVNSISMAGQLIKSSTGTTNIAVPITISGNIDSQSGNLDFTSTVSQVSGTNAINGTLTAPSYSLEGGTLKGSGTIVGSLTAESGTIVAPGNSPGILNTGDFVLNVGAILESEISGLGANPGTDYDQVNVTGTVTLAGTLDAIRWDYFGAGQEFIIINNDGVDPVVGTFDGLPEGSPVAIDGINVFTISYSGGDGNDVVLTSEFGLLVADNTNDSGAGSLREAILSANANVGADIIGLSFSGLGPFTIALNSPLPDITESIQIDGSLLSGYAGSPIVVLDGSSAGALADGLKITGDDSLIRGLAIVNFGGDGIEVDGGDNNVIAGNYIGIASDGTTLGSNGGYGVLLINGAANNTVGGSTVGDRNVLSGHTSAGGAGVGLIGTGTSNNRIQGNYIGTNAAGSAALGNQIGVSLYSNAIGNIIGTDGDGTNDEFEGNLISGNVTGINLQENVDDTVIAGNWIGLNAAGTGTIGNTVQGIRVFEDMTTSGLRIGTNADGLSDIFERNVISGNGITDVYLPGTTDAVVAGNFIGTNAAGTATLGTVTYGVTVSNGSTGVRVGSNGDGVNDAVERNVISGHTSYGIGLDGVGTDNNTIAGNYIGTDASGLIALGETVGISITSGASNSIIGGFTSNPGTGAGNVIAGTTSRGILISTSAGNGTLVRGNIIGLGADGVTDLTVSGEGVRVQAGLNAIIGGDDAADGIVDGLIQARNIISGFGASNQAGIAFSASGSNLNTTIQGNYIGTDITGTIAVPNYTGIAVGNAPGTTIGGTSSGAGNVISGNVVQGVYVFNGGASTVQGNIIGLDAAGDAVLGNEFGVQISTSSNLIGGTDVAARNIISGNDEGIRITGDTTVGNTIQGNFIGTDITGLLDRGNVLGIQIVSAVGTIIGGAIAGARNVISGNETGVLVESFTADPTSTLIAGNYIGVDVTGAGALGNQFDGIDIRTGGNTIGGTDSLARNVISGQGQRGIVINGINAVGNTVAGNYIGTDESGNLPIPNFVGVRVTSASNTIGGNVAGAGNLISGNAENGVYITGVGGNTIQGNTVGLNVTGDVDLGNVGAGIMLESTPNNVIGGSSSLARNIIGGNDFVGIYAFGITTTVNIIRGNYIGTDATGTVAIGNGLTGIVLTGDASSNIVGGDSTAGEGNLISGNANSGIALGFSGGKSTNNVVQGNIIGLDVTGLVAMPNSDGLTIAEGASSGNQIGGTGTGQGNIISGNLGRGVVISGTGADNNVLAGNFIGTNISGTAAIGNASVGIVIEGGASNNTIGGTTSTARNLVSGNTGDGVLFTGIGTDSNVLVGNYIGLNSAGTGRIANSLNGILITSGASGNRIGTDGDGVNDSEERNVISGNSSGTNANVNIFGIGTTGNVVAGNYIGTTADGLSTVVNSGRGVRIATDATGNRIGTDGSSDAFNANERNVISGHSDIGIFVVGGANNNVVAGNYVGLDVTGTAVLGNSVEGIYLNGVSGIQLGSNADGVADELEGNVISGNGGWGVLVTTNATLNTVAGNRIGTNAAGTSVMPNALGGLLMGANATFNTIGGTAAGAGNLISGNFGPGIAILRTYLGVTYPASPNNTVAGNLIGTDVTGTLDFGNSGPGIRVEEPNTTIGGTTAAGRNVISGNDAEGILITGSTATSITVLGNYIGTDVSGSFSIANLVGVTINSGATNNTIGGASTSSRNILSGNTNYGVHITGAGTSNNVVSANYVGSNSTALAPIANGIQGIAITDGAFNNRIGTNGDGVDDAEERNIISGNGTNGLWLSGIGTTDNVIAGNYIGTNITGLVALPNGHSGIWMNAGASGNIIGTDGSNDAFNGNERNVIAGNLHSGLYLIDSGTNSNVIAGNYIGLDSTGSTEMGNSHSGIVFIGGASGNIIGTDGNGIGDELERNVISGNVEYGVLIYGSGTDNNLVAGNFIGTDFTGTGSVANGRAASGGVLISAGSQYNVIGTNGDGIGDAAEGNLISGNNGWNGLWIDGFNSNYNVVAGNRIGTDVTGTLPLANSGMGVEIKNGASFNLIGTNADGVSDTTERNIISANLSNGVWVWQQDGNPVPADNVIAGNFIGTDITGTQDLGNAAHGILLAAGSTRNIIGTNGDRLGDELEANLISGNNIHGIVINGIGTSQNRVAGNYIGTDLTGEIGLGNAQVGVLITAGATNNLIGTDANGIGDISERNVISGNRRQGILINSSSTNNVIAGNYIGTDKDGMSSVANGDALAIATSMGIHIIGNASFNRVGTNGDGINDAIEGNVLSGNIGDGIKIQNSSNNNVVAGNFIGTNFNGTGVIGNGRIGVFIQAAGQNRIGTDSNGIADSVERNIIAGNASHGISIVTAGATGNLIAGNYIGTDVTGTLDFGNSGNGLSLTSDATNTIIGGTSPASRNVISGNNLSGVLISSATATGNTVLGNYIGVNASGTAALANSTTGVLINSAASNNTIGGSTLGARNVISGNLQAGVTVQGAGTNGNAVAGNFIGTDATGLLSVPNGGVGMYIEFDAANTRVGTNGDGIGDLEERNVIAGHSAGAIFIQNNATGTVVAGNYIGVNANGTAALPLSQSTGAGITVHAGATNTRIGTDGSNDAFNINERNVIGGVAWNGVVVGGVGTTATTIAGNYLGTDATGTSAIGNSIGVAVWNGASDVRIGTNSDGIADELERNVVSGNRDVGIDINGVNWDGAVPTTLTNNVLVAGNYIGTNATGTGAIPNTNYGVQIRGGATNVSVGNGAAGAGNVISGNGDRGLVISGLGTDSSIVAGNFIGTNASGTGAIGNGTDGIWVINGPKFTRIGTDGDGVNDAAERNIISGNLRNGVQFEGAGTNNNIVAGNYIGTDLHGTSSLGNGWHGVIIFGTASNNRIGTDGSADAFNASERNIISSNGQYGIRIRDVGTNGTIVTGNFIGTDATGQTNFGNGFDGIILLAGTSLNRIGTNSDGIADDLERNVISGSLGHGINITGAGTSNNLVAGNFIGTNATGDLAVRNRGSGVAVLSGATNNTIGGTTLAARNVISGNSNTGVSRGVLLSGPATQFNSIVGNFVGLSATGNAAIPNDNSGILVSGGARSNTIGGPTPDHRNYISGNTLAGIAFSGANVTQNVAQGNWVGLDASGTFAVPNQVAGIGFVDFSTSNSAIGNVVSGNTSLGITIQQFGGAGGPSNNNLVQGNIVGLDPTGKFAIPNTGLGINISSGSTGNTIGGPNADERNVVSGNTTSGISLSGTGTSLNTIAGNYVGTDISGALARGNGSTGIFVGSGAASNVIGGTSIGHRNLISGNVGSGIQIDSNSNVVQGNYVGVNAQGSQALSNQGRGIFIQGAGNVIGGLDSTSRNIVSGNWIQGIELRNAGATLNTIQGNFVGTDATGTFAIGNGGNGLTMGFGASSNVASSNVISGNQRGVLIREVGSDSNWLHGNLIGTDVFGTSSIPNAQGVLLQNGVQLNIIGTNGDGVNDEAERNVISGNAGSGVGVSTFNSIGPVNNTVAGNYIGTDVSGSQPLGNQGFGVVISNNSSANKIGLDVANGGNLISANAQGGIQHSSTLSNSIFNNRIGTNVTGTLDLGNAGPGVSVTDGLAIVGGLASNRSNRIAFNTLGVVVTGAGRATIRGNAIFDNDGLGIDLGSDGVTANDTGDFDTGASGLQNYPLLSTPAAGGQTRVIGQLSSTPFSVFDIDFYASTQADSSGFGEGKRYLGTISVTTTESGAIGFDQLVPGLTLNGDLVSAIVTDSGGNSSEFSAAVVASSLAPPTVDSSSLILTDITEDEDVFGLPTTVFNEGRAVRLDGLFVDAGLADAHTVLIDWGDGSAQTVLNIPAGPRGFSAEHLYSDDRPSGTPQDTYPITILVSNNTSNASGTASTEVQIVNVVPELAQDVALSSSAGFEGDTFTLTGSFIDPGTDLHTLRVDWGDASGLQTIQLPLGARTFSVPHTFVDDSQSISLWLNDDDSPAVFAGATFNIAIANRSPVPAITGPLTAIEGSSIALSASSMDPGMSDSATYSWVVSLGITPILQGTGTNFSFTPANEGVYSVQLTATDDDGATGTVTRNIAVENAAPQIVPGSLVFEDAVTGASLLSVPEGVAFVLTGSVSDAGSDDTHVVEIDWGDGSPLTMLSLPKGVTVFASEHTYADDDPTGTASDLVPIRVTVVDDQGASGFVLRDTTVANAPPEVSIVDNGSDDSTIRLRAEIEDPSAADTFQVLWTVMGTTPLGMPPTTATTLSVEFPRTGSGFITAVVEVTDDDLGVGTDTATIVIGTAANDQITVQPSSQSGTVSVALTSNSTTTTADVSEESTVLILGQGGADTITVDSSLEIATRIDAGEGNDTVFGGAGADTITGGVGNDLIVSGNGPDVIDASLGDDTVDSGQGNDVIQVWGFSDKTLIDSGGVDTLDFSRVPEISSNSHPTASSGVALDLSKSGGQIQTVRADGSISLAGEFENAVGTEFGDKFYGNSANNLLFGGFGNDSLYSGSGDDSVYTGTDPLGGGDDSIDGGLGNDLIFGGVLGNDSLAGGDGDDSIYGSGGSNNPTGPLTGVDTLTGGDGNDLIFGGVFGNDSIDGGVGDDTIRSGGGDSVGGGTGDDTIGGGDGNDLIFGGFFGSDSIDGGDGDDSIFGTGGDPTVGGGQGDDTIAGGQGNDLIFGGGIGSTSIDGGTGNDSIYGGGGNDTVGGENTLIGGDGNDLIFGAAVRNDSIDGGSGDDTINSATGNDLIFGGPLGEVSVVGAGGDDSISGGDGNDLIFGGFGNVTIDGGSGNDSIQAGGGDQTIRGGTGNDLIFGGVFGNDTIDGGLGDDTIRGGSGNSTLLGGSGNDSIVSAGGNDLIFGGFGSDTLIGGSGDVSIIGAEGNDLIFGGPIGNDTLDGGSGDDTIYAGGGNQTVSGGSGNDLIFGGVFGNDTIDGGAGSDTITGGQGNTSVSGGAGNDLIFGGLGGTDSLDGGAGDDSIYASSGNDTVDQDNTIFGGDGNDLIFGALIGSDSIDGGAGDDTIYAASGNDLIFGGAIGDVSVVSTSGNDSIHGGAGNDLIFGAAVGNDTIDGGAGDDTIYASQGNDLIFGGAIGEVTVVGTGGNDSISGGSGNDLIFGGPLGRDTLDGGIGDDSIVGAGGNDLIFGGFGNDTIRSGPGSESIIAGEGNDLIFGLSVSADTIDGGAGDDSIQGSSGNDLIFGGFGNDTIESGSGTETIYGGDGNDLIFGGSAGADSIDAGAGDDTVVVGGGGSDMDSIDGSSGNDLIFADVTTDATLTADRLNLGGTGEYLLLNMEAVQLVGNAANNLIDASASPLNAYLVGGFGDDSLVGGSGDDTLIGGGGNDLLSGGPGNDLYWFSGGQFGTVQVIEATNGGVDTFDFSMMTSAVDVDLSSTIARSVAPGLVMTIAGDIENVIGSDFNDTLTGNALDNHLIGAGGQDLLQGGSGDDRIEAGRRRTVFLDFDSASEVGEHVYTVAERAAILERIEADYAPFDIEFVTTRPASGPFVTILFNAAVFLPGSQFVLGGISERIGWRELAGGGVVQVDVNGFFGSSGNRLPATTENFIALSSTIAAHELAHTYGLRHEDAFGPPGTGIFEGSKNAQRYRPVFTGLAAAVETRVHLIASPASVGTSLIDALGNPYFGERESLKLAFAENGSVITELADGVKQSMTLGTSSVLVQPLGMLPAVSVPNTLMPGALNYGRELTAAASTVVGEIKLGADNRSENDYYSFVGSKDDVVTIEVLSQTLRHRFSNPIDSIVRVLDSTGQKVAYHSSFTGAFNDDSLEPTDSLLIDLELPADGIYYVEVDTFSFAAPEFPSYQPTFDIQAYAARFPNDPAVTDRDRGQYELLIYRFDGTVPIAASDTLIGGLGSDVLYGNSGKETVLGFNSLEDLLFDSSGTATQTNSAPLVNSIADQAGVEGGLITFIATATDADDNFADGWSLASVDGFSFATGATIDPVTGLFEFVPVNNGEFAVRVVATDVNGAAGSQIVLFTVTNVAPEATIVAISTPRIEGSAIVVTASASDVGAADVLTYTYEVLKNGSVESSQTGVALTSFNFVPADSGEYELRLTVSDGDGGTHVVSNLLDVANVAPTADLVSNSPVDEGSAVVASFANAFDVSATDVSSGLKYSFATNFAGLAATYDAASSSPNFEVATEDDGPILIYGRIFDKDGGYTDYSTTVVVRNVAPTATLVNGGAVSEGSSLTVSFANADDVSVVDRNAGLRYSFARTLSELAATYADATSVSTAEFSTTDNGSVVIYGRVFDKDGGFTDYSTTVDVNNVAPTSIMSNGGAVDEGSSLSVSFAGTTDVSSEDALQGFRYSFATSVAELATAYATAGLPASASFFAADDGTFVIYGRVFDKDGGFTDYSTTVTVNNVAPTVSLAVSPADAVSAGTSVTVTSATNDPAGLNDSLSFAWVVTKDGNAFDTQAGGGGYFLAAPAAGVYVIALTVDDGDGGVTTASRTITVTGAPNVPPTVRIFEPEFSVLNNATRFRFKAYDTDSGDANGTFTYTVDWGDGTSSVVSASKDTYIWHTYTTLSPNGYFTITATATDERGAVGPAVSNQFIVSGYFVAVDPVNTQQSILIVVGTNDDDRIKLKERGDDYLKIKIQDDDHDVRVRGFQNIGNVARILVFGWDDEDEITIDDDIYLPTEIWGGDDDDKIKGGSGNDIIFGEAGDDKIYGGDGRDLLFGGLGEDRLYGDRHDDIIVAGFTVFESSVPTNFAYDRNLTLEQQRAAVEAIMAEWSSNRSYSQRVANIRGTGSGPRANGNNFLIASSTLANSTVFDDNAEDKIWGDSGIDWFFYNVDGDLGTKKDRAYDRSNSEARDDLDRWF